MDYGPVDRQEHDRTDRGGEDPRALIRESIPSERPAEEARDEGAGDAEEDRHDDSSGILPGHDQLCEGARDETNEQRSDETHISSSPFLGFFANDRPTAERPLRPPTPVDSPPDCHAGGEMGRTP